MITINSAPLLNRVILDANNTLISVTSTNGIGYYFRALISINDELFDEQGWSRKDNFTAENDFSNFYKAYFENDFSDTFVSGLSEQTNLIKKVSIVINEISIETDVVVQTISLPDFFIMYNATKVVFNDTPSVQFLGVNPDVLNMSPTGKISIPFFCNANDEDIVLTLKNDIGTTLNTITNSAITGKKAYLYNFDLSSLTISDAILFLTLDIAVGATTISKVFRLYRYAYSNYPVKELVFRNNFGYYIYVYLDGQLTIDKNLEIKSFEQNDYTDKVYEINEGQTYIINSGSLVENEKLIISQIVNSLDPKLFLNSTWYDLKPETKKVLDFKDRNHSYSENLTFKGSRSNFINNSGISSFTPLKVVNIVLGDPTDEDKTITNRYKWDVSSFEEVIDTFLPDYISRFSVAIGAEGINEFPLRDKTIYLQSCKKSGQTGEFFISKSNRLGYIISETEYDESDYAEILSAATFISVTSSVDGEGNVINEGSFDFARTTNDEILYLIWDYTDWKPIAVDNSSIVSNGMSTIVDVLTNDTVYGNPVVTISTPPTNGTAIVNVDNTITYEHNGTATISDSFEYQVSNGINSDIATVNMTITEEGTLNNYYYEGNDHAEDEGGSPGTVEYYDEFGELQESTGLYIGECRLIQAQSIFSALNVHTCTP
jgi:hypothetical protein